MSSDSFPTILQGRANGAFRANPAALYSMQHPLILWYTPFALNTSVVLCGLW